jgi:ribose transport system ATP-binding protein
MSLPRLRISGVTKSFGATQALRGVSIEVAAGEVHAIIGENGAGKSTLMKILSGACRPDDGKMELDGESFVPRNPLHARQSGIAMIYQELNLAPHLSVEENITLGCEPATLGVLSRSKRRARARAALAEIDAEHIPLAAPIYSRSIAEQQMVEIARALLCDPKVLIMDEPTSSLTQVDSEKLFGAIVRLRDRGVSILYISHFLEECQRLASRYTVLRDGETVDSGDMRSASLTEIVHRMVGREIKDIYPRQPRSFGKTVLELKQLRGATKPQSATLVLREGEILGIAGLVGAGRTETLRVLFGLDRIKGGSVVLNGRERTWSTPRQRLDSGIGLLSENRKEEGLMLNRTLADNLTMTRLKPFVRGGLLSGRKQNSSTKQWMERLGVRARHPAQLMSELSGGNQQKIAIGRLLHHEATILLLDEPTRGIDVASKAQIYHLIGELAGAGKAIVFVSSYLPELLGICDTIGVMCRGTLADARPVEQWTEHSIINAAIGQPEHA